MSFLAGVVAKGNAADPRRGLDGLLRRTDRFGTRARFSIAETPRMVVCGFARKPQMVEYARPRAPDEPWVVGDAASVSREEAARFRKRLQPGRPIPADACGRNLSVRLLESEERIEICTDVLGTVSLFIGSTADHVYFSTDFGAVASALAESCTLDCEQALVELTLGNSPSDRTVLGGVEVVPANAVLQIGADGPAIVEQRALEFGQDIAGWTDEQKFLRLDEIFAGIASSYLKPRAGRLVLSLSTGFDSRYGLALAGTAGLSVPCHTFGHPASLEVFGARRVAAKAGRTTEVFELPPTRWESWRDLVATTGTCGTVQWCGWGEQWARYLSARADGVMIGYLGETLSGVRLNFEDSGGDWLTHYFKATSHWDVTRPDSAPPHLAPSWARRALDTMREMAAERLKSCVYAQSFQQALFLNLYGRQRRHVSSQANLLSHFLTPVTYLYDGPLFAFCSQLPAGDLHGQRLYLAYARSRFPELFPAKAGQVTYSLGERLSNKVRAMLGDTRIRSRPPVIDRSLIIEPHRDRIMQLARKHGEFVSPLIDVDAFCELVASYSGSQGPESTQIIMTTNLFHLIDCAFEPPPGETADGG